MAIVGTSRWSTWSAWFVSCDDARKPTNRTQRGSIQVTIHDTFSVGACALCTLRLPRLSPRAFLSSWFRLVTPYAVNTCHVWTPASLTLAVMHVRIPATASCNNRNKERNWRKCSANKPIDSTIVSPSFYSWEFECTYIGWRFARRIFLSIEWYMRCIVWTRQFNLNF